MENYFNFKKNYDEPNILANDILICFGDVDHKCILTQYPAHTYTGGVKEFANQFNCHWLIAEIFACFTSAEELHNNFFLCIEFFRTKRNDSTFMLIVTDGETNILFKKEYLSCELKI